MYEWLANLANSGAASGGGGGILSSMAPAAASNSGGILSWLGSSPQSLGGSSDPSMSRLGLIGSGLKDVGATFNGQPANNLMGSLQEFKAKAARDALNQKIKAAYASGDMNAVRQALLEAEMASPGSTKHITDAMGAGQTEYSTTPQQLADGSWGVVGKNGTVKQLSVGIAADPNKAFGVGKGGAAVPNIPYQNYELNKAKAGKTNVTVNAGNTLGTSLAGGVGDILKASQGTASGALQTIDTANQIKTAIDSGKVMAGPTTSWKMAAGQLFGGDQETLNQTRATIQGLAKLSLAGRSALKGQGQISDFEGKLLQRATSGDIDSMTVGEIRTITDIAERAARAQIKNHGATLSRVTKTLPPDMANMLDVYRVDEPASNLPDPLGIRGR